jgi:hypothetical protein
MVYLITDICCYLLELSQLSTCFTLRLYTPFPTAHRHLQNDEVASAQSNSNAAVHQVRNGLIMSNTAIGCLVGIVHWLPSCGFIRLIINMHPHLRVIDLVLFHESPYNWMMRSFEGLTIRSSELTWARLRYSLYLSDSQKGPRNPIR